MPLHTATYPRVMLDGTEFDRWRAEATEALETARLARNGGRRNWACFLAEQAAQLAVKATLHGVGAGPWGHDLLELDDVWNQLR